MLLSALLFGFGAIGVASAQTSPFLISTLRVSAGHPDAEPQLVTASTEDNSLLERAVSTLGPTEAHAKVKTDYGINKVYVYADADDEQGNGNADAYSRWSDVLTVDGGADKEGQSGTIGFSFNVDGTRFGDTIMILEVYFQGNRAPFTQVGNTLTTEMLTFTYGEEFTLGVELGLTADGTIHGQGLSGESEANFFNTAILTSIVTPGGAPGDTISSASGSSLYADVFNPAAVAAPDGSTGLLLLTTALPFMGSRLVRRARRN